MQGPGCLNYSLIMNIQEGGPVSSISSANRFVMERNRAALERLLGRPVTISGCTDLAIDELKFSGNAQRRRKRSLLFHGCFLLNLDLALVGAVLPLPSRQPEYRANRGHGEFLANLNIPAADVKAALRSAWGADAAAGPVPRGEIALLARDKYATSAWNFKF